MSKNFVHRYDVPDNKCPECENQLDQKGGVLIEFIVGRTTLEVESRLDKDGFLEDVDGAIEAGFHSDTTCSVCGYSLAYDEDATAQLENDLNIADQELVKWKELGQDLLEWADYMGGFEAQVWQRVKNLLRK